MKTEIEKANLQDSMVTFKERVATCATQNARIFKENFVEYEYCVCSKAFQNKIMIVKALDRNYLHLVGVNTALPADSFFKKCLNGTLNESDFDFSKPGVGKNALKGAVRDKIKVLPDMVNIFNYKGVQVQSDFQKNQIVCAFASSNGNCTLGFANSGHPKSLLRGDYLEENTRYPVDAIFRRKSGTDTFDEVMWEPTSELVDYKDVLEGMLDKGLLETIFS